MMHLDDPQIPQSEAEMLADEDSGELDKIAVDIQVLAEKVKAASKRCHSTHARDALIDCYNHLLDDIPAVDHETIVDELRDP